MLVTDNDKCAAETNPSTHTPKQSVGCIQRLWDGMWSMIAFLFLVIWKIILLCLIGLIFRLLVFIWQPWKVLAVLLILAFGVGYRFLKPQKTVMLYQAAARVLTITVVASILITTVFAGVKAYKFWYSPVIPTGRGDVSRSEWWEKDFQPWYQTQNENCQSGAQKKLLSIIVFPSILSLEIIFALYVPQMSDWRSIVESADGYETVPAVLTWEDDPIHEFTSRLDILYYGGAKALFIKPRPTSLIRSCTCSYPTFANEWQYFMNVNKGNEVLVCDNVK